MSQASKDHLVHALARERKRARDTGHKKVENIPLWSRLQKTTQLLEVLGRIAEKLKAAIINHKSFLKTMMAEKPEILKYDRKNPQIIRDVQRYLAG